jgi:zinc transport system substrate-binding protein
MQKIATFIICTLLIVGCTTKSDSDKKTIFVTITPMQSIIEEITAGDFDIEVIVPKGASPETFEPTSSDIARLNDAEMVFSTGLISFEHSLTHNLGDRVINLSEGIAALEGTCSHHHCHHSHGIDPHIWTSPRELSTMVGNMHRALMSHYPDSTKYNDAAERIVARLDSLDSYCRAQLGDGKKRAIMIYHPAYTYLAHNYNIEQIAIENEGKEPTAKHLVELIERGRKMGVRAIFHQPQYSADKLRSIAEELGADVIMTDPLAFDIESEIRRVVDIISEQNE